MENSINLMQITSPVPTDLLHPAYNAKTEMHKQSI